MMQDCRSEIAREARVALVGLVLLPAAQAVPRARVVRVLLELLARAARLAPPAPRGFCAAWSGMHAEFLQIVEAEDREASLANVHEAKVDVATALAIYESARGEAGWVRVAS